MRTLLGAVVPTFFSGLLEDMSERGAFFAESLFGGYEELFLTWTEPDLECFLDFAELIELLSGDDSLRGFVLNGTTPCMMYWFWRSSSFIGDVRELLM